MSGPLQRQLARALLFAIVSVPYSQRQARWTTWSFPQPDGRTKASERDAAHSLKPALRPGMRLVREWNGRMHAVDVTEEGFLFDGRVYRSLSAIAKRITGAHWSGPRFFGVRA